MATAHGAAEALGSERPAAKRNGSGYGLFLAHQLLGGLFAEVHRDQADGRGAHEW